VKASHLAGVVVIAGLASITVSEQARAISYSIVQNDIVNFPTTSNGFSTPNFGGATMDYVNTSLANVYRSPWEGTSSDNLQYTSVRSGTAGYNLIGNSLSFLWGSPDYYNTLTFWTGVGGTGASVSLTGDLLGDPQHFGHHLVQILTSETFLSVTFGTDTIPAFEFANLVATTTPIPAALPLFATGVGLLGWFARRRKRKQTTPIAA
jgi:hypothetical protein